MYMLKKLFPCAVLIFLGGVIIFLTSHISCKAMKPYVHVETVSDAIALFPKSVADIKRMAQRAIETAQQEVALIIAVPEHERTYANTGKACDHLFTLSDFSVAMRVLFITQMLHPDKDIRDAAQEEFIRLEAFSVDFLSDNVELYRALKSYVYGNAMNEVLSDEQRYFLQLTLDDFKRGGLDLPEDERAVVKQIKKDISQLVNKFDANIAQDNRTITVERAELAGLDDHFIEHLDRTNDGGYVLGIDYPTYQNVMENCSISQTRHKLAQAYVNRAYPVNDSLLKEIFIKRDELAQRLGFDNYAALDLDNQMVKTPQHAQDFLTELIDHVRAKEQLEFDRLVQDLPAGVTLSADGKMQPWDQLYVKSMYRKKHFALDEREIANYFPMEKTIEGLLHIYEQFFSLKFKQVPVSGAWHEDVRCIEVRTVYNNQLQGYLFLDLYPRANKYSHACHADIIPTYYAVNGAMPPSISIVIANFPKSTGARPALLIRSDVSTFFHEFGHALHAILGRTQVASQCGTHVKTDFVEMPSQMLEEWLYDRAILKLISGHYQTGEKLPDEIIETIIALKNFDAGSWVQRQAYLASLALTYHEGEPNNLQQIMQHLQKTIRTNIEPMHDDHIYASFGHLTGYGAKYYGYLWSKVFALDLFNEIKQHGLLDPEIGQKYINCIIGRGGSKDPNELLKDFLGREPNQEAFLADMGLK